MRPQWPRSIEEIIAEQKEKAEAEKKAKEEADKNQKNEDNEEAPKEDNAEATKEEEKQENVDDEEEEKAKELAPDPPQIMVKYVITMDTLGDEQLYNQAIIEWIDENISKFEAVLMKIDLMQYLQQREFEENLKIKLSEYDEKTKGEIDAKIAEIEKENEESAEEIKSFKKHHQLPVFFIFSAHVYNLRKYVSIIVATQSIWSLICNHAMKPDQSSYCRIIAAFTKLFEQDNALSFLNKELSQLDVISNAAWNQCLKCLKDITSEKVGAFNPSENESFDVVFIEKLIDGMNVEEIGNEGLALIMTMLYQFVDSACKLYKFVEEEKRKKKAAEEEKANAPNVDKQEEDNENE